MKELGTQSVALHRQVGEVVSQLKLDRLLILADLDEATALAEGARGVTTDTFADHDTLASFLRSLLQPGDRVLFKASRSVAMEKVVDQLVAGFQCSESGISSMRD
jgi:UDP-N-acetylmuramoyl-tripeptide--D-alanyl-D-alanine ligase